MQLLDKSPGNAEALHSPGGKSTTACLWHLWVPFGALGYTHATKSVAEAMCSLSGCMLLMPRLWTAVLVCIGQLTSNPPPFWAS